MLGYRLAVVNSLVSYTLLQTVCMVGIILLKMSKVIECPYVVFFACPKEAFS